MKSATNNISVGSLQLVFPDPGLSYCTGSQSWLPGTLKWNGANVNVIRYTCVTPFPVIISQYTHNCFHSITFS